jgi:chlorobactene glucosyltransferase
METYLPHDLIFHLIIFQSVVLGVVLSNLLLLHRSRKHTPPDVYPLVSVLIPARNEERNIGACVQSLLTQDYPSFEILVLDDQSSDGTLAILTQMAGLHPRLKILEGQPTPEDLLGKNWACSQLARQAQGELLFFTDADTIHQPRTLQSIVTALIGEKADLVTGFPRQQVLTWGERLLVPFFPWALLCYIPWWLAYRVRLPVLAAAVGQLMVFRREAYQAVGGHAALGTAIVDDLMLTRKVKKAGLSWRVARVSDLISCRMYNGGLEAARGFRKNLFAAFDFRLLVFLFVFLWLIVQFWVPLIVFTVYCLGLAPIARPDQLVVCISLSLLLWLIPYIELRIPFYLGLIYPLTILANEVVAFQSLVSSLTGRLTWKDRPLGRQKWRWL